MHPIGSSEKEDPMKRAVIALILAGAPLARAAATLTVSSSAFADGAGIPMEYSCEGKGSPPPLSWSQVPAGTQSVAILVEDPDAPKGPFAHWVIYNIPPATYSLPLPSANVPAAATIGLNSNGSTGWAAACPPSGLHHYRFRVFALDTKLPELQRATAEALRAAMDGHILAQGLLTGTYVKRGAPAR
jgi:Raf kinase inhibitor-like YbhB/YbcL family protein